MNRGSLESFLARLIGLRRRSDRGQSDDAAFRFRNYFLSDHQNVAVFKSNFRAASGKSN